MSNFGNQFKTYMLLGVLTSLVVVIGSMLGGQSGMVIAFGFAIIMNGVSYWHSDKMAIKMTRSEPATQEKNPQLFEMVERLSYKANLPMPKLYITPSNQPNAFATGRNPQHSAVAVTVGLLSMLSKEEVEGVIAHELAHIKNRDVLVGTLAAVMAGVITMIADMAQWALIFGRGDEDSNGLAALPLIILGPIAAIIIQMTVSRSREYMADATGAEIAGNSEGLASALLKLEQASKYNTMKVSPAASHMFIVNPLAGSTLRSLFSTHPPINERVRRLRGR